MRNARRIKQFWVNKCAACLFAHGGVHGGASRCAPFDFANFGPLTIRVAASIFDELTRPLTKIFGKPCRHFGKCDQHENHNDHDQKHRNGGARDIAHLVISHALENE